MKNKLLLILLLTFSCISFANTDTLVKSSPYPLQTQAEDNKTKKIDSKTKKIDTIKNNKHFIGTVEQLINELIPKRIVVLNNSDIDLSNIQIEAIYPINATLETLLKVINNIGLQIQYNNEFLLINKKQ